MNSPRFYLKMTQRSFNLPFIHKNKRFSLPSFIFVQNRSFFLSYSSLYFHSFQQCSLCDLFGLLLDVLFVSSLIFPIFIPIYAENKGKHFFFSSRIVFFCSIRETIEMNFSVPFKVSYWVESTFFLLWNNFSMINNNVHRTLNLKSKKLSHVIFVNFIWWRKNQSWNNSVRSYCIATDIF